MALAVGVASRPAADGPPSRPAAGSAGASPPSSRGEALRPTRSPEYYPGTSLRCPPPPIDPARDVRLPLPGSSGAARRREADHLRQDDVDREGALRAELSARLPADARDREPPAPWAPAARAATSRPSDFGWRRGRGEFARGERWDDGAHGSHAHARVHDGDRRFPRVEGRRDDWRSPRADAQAWRRDATPPGLRSPGLWSAESPSAPALSKKKKKSKKKKAAAAVPGMAVGPASSGAPE
ncbi:hypothetical protein ZWY2020_050140 [Hordeum vulgare]|nr:hypothetical protein ZWY2020_050140 [Hordeum vulgare]